MQACATHPPALPGAFYSGRLAVRTDASEAAPARALSGQFELSGSAADGQLVLTSPIGLTVARARWSHPAGAQGLPSDIELEADGHRTHYDTLEALMQQALGDQLPLAALFDWLGGHPWPNAPATPDVDGRSFSQLGWHVDRSQWDTARLLIAERAAPPPALHVRVKLDAPDPDPASPAPSAAPAASSAP